MHEEFRIRLDGPPGGVELDALLAAGDRLRGLLDHDRRLPWRVRALADDGLTVGLDDPTPASRTALRTVRDGLLRLRAEPGLPSGWDQSMARELLELAGLPKRCSVHEVELSWPGGGPVLLTAEVHDHVDATIAPATSALGSIRGTVHRYNGVRRDIGIIDRATGRAVAAKFEEPFRTRLLRMELLEREVVAWGTVVRNARGHKTELHLDGIELVDTATAPTPVEEMVGLFDAGPTVAADLSEVSRSGDRHSSDNCAEPAATSGPAGAVAA